MPEELLDLTIAKKYVQLYRSAIDRNISFNMSLKKVRQLVTRKTCYFTGIKFNPKTNHKYSRTIDRLDNTKGYTDDNVVACTKHINGIKDNATIDDILAIYKSLKKTKLIH